MKKVLVFSAFLAVMLLTMSNGECKMPDSNIFAHNVKPKVIMHSPIKTGNHFNVNKQNLKFKPNVIAKKHHKNNFYKKYKRITRIGNKPVFYKGNRIHTIGGHRVFYAPNGRIKQIGSLPVVYQNNQIQQVGTLPIVYSDNNEIIKIGNWSVSYDV